MNRRFSSLMLLGLLAAAGCVSTSGGQGSLDPVKPESFGAFECRERGDVASPPPREILEPRNAKEGERQPARPKPLLTQSLCPDGQVPVAKEGPDPAWPRATRSSARSPARPPISFAGTPGS